MQMIKRFRQFAYQNRCFDDDVLKCIGTYSWVDDWENDVVVLFLTVVLVGFWMGAVSNLDVLPVLTWL